MRFLLAAFLTIVIEVSQARKPYFPPVLGQNPGLSI